MNDEGKCDDPQQVTTNDENQQNLPEIDPNVAYDQAIDFIKKEMFINAENSLLSIIPFVSSNLSIESNQKLFPKIISKLLLVMYINNSKVENPVNYILTKIKSLNIPNLSSYWELALNQVADDVVTDYYKCIRLLSVDFFVKINPFKYFPTEAPKSDFKSVTVYVSIARQCSNKLNQSLVDEIAFSFFSRLKDIFSNIENNDLRNIDEKRLQILMKDFHEMSPSRDFSAKLDRFNTNIMFIYCQSSNLSKQYEGLLRFNEIRSLKHLLDRIIKNEIPQKLLSNIHESIVMEFVKFLTHLFDAGYYNREILVQFWNISLNQYVSVIDKFFAAWAYLFISIPHKALSDFWTECVYKTKTFPLAALNFLCQVRSRATTLTIKTEVTTTLWNAMEALPMTSEKAKIEYVNALSFYTTFNTNQWSEMKAKCFEFISSGQNVAFAVSLLSRIWRNVNSETTQKEFDLLLCLGRTYNNNNLNTTMTGSLDLNLASNLKQFENGNEINSASVLYVKSFIHLLFDLIKNMANGLDECFTENEVNLMKPLLLIYLNTSIDIYERRLIQEISSHLSNKSSSEMIQWLCGLKNVDSSVFSLIRIFFNQINNIDLNSPIKVPLKSLTGIDLIWNLLFSVNLYDIPSYLATLAVQCSDVESASYFIEKCMSNINNKGSILALNYLVYKVEILFDIDSYKIKRNMFEMPNTFLTVEITGDINKTLKIRSSTKPEDFIKKIARLLNTIESAVLIYYEHERLSVNHIFKQDQQFSVTRNPTIINAPPIRVWNVDKNELPPQLIQPYFSKIYSLLDKEKSISEDALILLNYIPTNKEERRKIEFLVNNQNNSSSWEELLNVDHPYHTLYRINIIGNLLISDNRVFEKAFFENGGFKRFLDILFSTRKTYTIHNINKILDITRVLFDTGNKSPDLYEFKNQVLADTGVKNLPEIVTWIFSILKGQKNYNNACLLMKIVTQIVQLNKDILPKLEEFPELVSLTIFHENELIRTSIMETMNELDPINYKQVLFDNIENSIYGKCNEYFCLMQCVIKQTKDSLNIWNLLSNFLLTHLFIYKNKQTNSNEDEINAEFENDQFSMIDNSDDKQFNDEIKMDVPEIKSRMKDLCSFVADFNFVDGIFYSLLLLIYNIDEIPNAEEFIVFVIDRIVFNTQQYIPLPSSCFDLLNQVILKNQEKLLPIVVDHLGKFHKVATPSPYLPALGQNNRLKGINNMGATCYLNSSLQQILNVRQIRDALFRYNLNNSNNEKDKTTTTTTDATEQSESESESKSENDKAAATTTKNETENIKNNKNVVVKFEDDWVSQLQQLLAKLIYSPLVSIDASPFVRVWKGWDDLPIDPHEQQDAGEFVQMLLDRLDSRLEGKPVSKSILGQFEERVVQINGNYSKELLTDFTVFPIQVENLSNFQESFKRFLEPDNLTGKDRYSVEDLGLIDAERYHTIYKAPETMIILLKRFEFDLETLSSKKVNSFFEFTKALDISPLLSDDSNKDEKDKIGEYELTGIVMHSGCVIGGHYYSYIKENDTEKWNCFNDSSVYQLEPNFMERCFGGKKLMNYYDQVKKRNVTEQVERTESAYLLFYKQNSRDKNDSIEPITMMSKNALIRFLTDIEQTIVRNMIMSLEYAEFIGSLADKMGQSEIFYDFLLKFVLKILCFPYEGSQQQAMMYESNSAFQYTKSINAVCINIRNKCQNDSSFASYILNHSNEIINFLLMNGNEQMRIKLLTLVNSAISNVPNETATKFVNEIVAQFNDDTFISHWRNFDQIFGPVLYYLNNIDAYRQDILDSAIQLLEKSKLQGDEYLMNVNLSSVFQIFLTIVKKLNKFKEYSQKVIDTQFLQTFSRSQKHLYDASFLVMNFQKDNKSITEHYLRTIQSKNLPPVALAALFASSISIEDTLSSSRIHVFISLIRMRASNKWTPDNVSQFFNETARLLNLHHSNKYVTICNYCDWIHYLFHTDLSLRKSIVEFAHSIFTSSNITNLLNVLLVECQTCVDLCLSCATSSAFKSDDCYPTPQYFELLYWAINLCHFDNFVIKNKQVFVKAMNSFGSLSSPFKLPIFNLIEFLNKTLTNQQIPIFFDSQTLSMFLKALSNTPADPRAFIEAVMPLMFHFITNIPQVDSMMVTKSNIFKLSLKYLLFESNTTMMNLFDKMLNKQTASIIAATVFETNFFSQHKCIKYSIDLMRKDVSTSETFLKSNCLQVVVNYLAKKYENRTALTSYQTLDPYMKILNVFSKSYISMVKNNESRSFMSWFSSPISKFIEFWNNNNKFITHLFLWTQMSSVPSTFSKQVFILIEQIFTSDPKFAQNAFDLLKRKQPDFLQKIDQESVIDYLKMVSSLYNTYSNSNLKDIVVNNYSDFDNLLKCDNSICNSQSIILVTQALKNQQQNISPETFEKFTFLYTILFSKTNEIQMFNQTISSAAFQAALNSSVTNESIQQWSTSLLLLVSKEIKELNNNEDSKNNSESIQMLVEDLKIAREFLEDAQGWTGIKISFDDLSIDDLNGCIEKIKNDPNYKKQDVNIARYFEKFIPK